MATRLTRSWHVVRAGVPGRTLNAFRERVALALTRRFGR
jgi:hypothetical protein